MMKHYVKLACFVGGALFGSAGVKLLASKDAKKAYTHITAAGLRMKDSVMETVTSVQENAADILAAAKDINEAMKVAASYAIAGLVAEDELSADYIIPKAFDKRVGPAVAEAVAKAARETGVARI